MKRIAIIGPESTGKTKLAKQLSAHYNAPRVPEFSRNYLLNLDRPYIQRDVEIIAKGQIDHEDQIAQTADDLLICDTNLVVIRVWMEVSYQNCPQWIEEEIRNRYYDLTLLCYPDIPWEPDPLREHPEMREALLEIYLKALDVFNIPFVSITGEYPERLQKAIQAVDSIR